MQISDLKSQALFVRFGEAPALTDEALKAPTRILAALAEASSSSKIAVLKDEDAPTPGAYNNAGDFFKSVDP